MKLVSKSSGEVRELFEHHACIAIANVNYEDRSIAAFTLLLSWLNSNPSVRFLLLSYWTEGGSEYLLHLRETNLKKILVEINQRGFEVEVQRLPYPSNSDKYRQLVGRLKIPESCDILVDISCFPTLELLNLLQALNQVTDRLLFSYTRPKQFVHYSSPEGPPRCFFAGEMLWEVVNQRQPLDVILLPGVQPVGGVLLDCIRRCEGQKLVLFPFWGNDVPQSLSVLHANEHLIQPHFSVDWYFTIEAASDSVSRFVSQTQGIQGGLIVAPFCEKPLLVECFYQLSWARSTRWSDLVIAPSLVSASVHSLGIGETIFFALNITGHPTWERA